MTENCCDIAYNTERVHSSIGMTPSAYEAHLAALSEQQRPQFTIYAGSPKVELPTQQLPIEWGR